MPRLYNKQRIAKLRPDYPPPYSRYESERVLKPAAGDLSSSSPEVVTEVRTTSRGNSHCRISFCCVGTVFVILTCVFLVSNLFPYPMHASCTVKWKFDEPCGYIMQKLRCQILEWSTCHGCGPRGTRCLYSLEGPKLDENSTIRATHITPNIRLIDGIKITFEQTINKSCTAVAKSESKGWFVIFDYGSNYCNLHNLVVGAGFENDHGFVESTNNAICTQLNMASCD